MSSRGVSQTQEVGEEIEAMLAGDAFGVKLDAVHGGVAVGEGVSVATGTPDCTTRVRRGQRPPGASRLSKARSQLPLSLPRRPR